MTLDYIPTEERMLFLEALDLYIEISLRIIERGYLPREAYPYWKAGLRDILEYAEYQAVILKEKTAQRVRTKEQDVWGVKEKTGQFVPDVETEANNSKQESAKVKRPNRRGRKALARRKVNRKNP